MVLFGMRRRGFLGWDYLGWIILGIITLSIVFAAFAIFDKVGSGGIGEIFRNLFGR